MYEMIFLIILLLFLLVIYITYLYIIYKENKNYVDNAFIVIVLGFILFCILTRIYEKTIEFDKGNHDNNISTVK